MAVDIGNAGVVRPGALRWLRAVGWMLVLFMGLALISGLGEMGTRLIFGTIEGVPWGTDGAARLPPTEKLIANIVGLALLLVSYWAAVHYGERRRLSELDLGRMVPELLGGLAIGAALMTVTIAVLWVCGLVTVTAQPVKMLLQALRFTAQSSISEELLLRAVMLRLLWRAFGPWWGIGLSALVFGALHLPNPNATVFAALCIALEAGVMLGAFYMLTGRLWVSIGLHAGWNFTQGWIFGAPVSGTDVFDGGPLSTVAVKGVAESLSGGAFGPEASLPGLIIATATGGAVLWQAWRRGHLSAQTDQMAPAP
jgi:uncharacterized protein